MLSKHSEQSAMADHAAPCEMAVCGFACSHRRVIQAFHQKGTLKPRRVFNFGKGTSCRQRCVLRTRVTASSSSSGRLYIVKVLDDFISRLMGNSVSP